MMADSKEFSTEEKIEIINSIKSLHLQNISIDEIIFLLNKLMGGYAIRLFIRSNLVFYRGIAYSPKPNFYQDLIYPPINKARVNRANDEGEQFFYGATKKKAVFYELVAKPGDTFVISTWVTSENLLLSNVGYTTENLKTLGADDTTPFDNESGLATSKDQNMVADFLARTFSQAILDENIYKLTISIARMFLGKVNDFHSIPILNEIDGVLYPTIKYNANANNIVLKKKSVDTGKVILDRIEFIEIVDCIDNKYQYKIIDVSEGVKDDIIQWNNLQDSWTINDEVEDIYFVDKKAFNEAGDEIEPDK